MITIETSVAGSTVSVVDPETAPSVALTLVDPGATAVARPAVSIVATEVSTTAHVTCEVMSCELPSLHVPVAVSCAVVLTTADGDPGVTAMLVRIGVTVSAREPLTAPIAATIFALPLATAVAIPEPFTVAMLVELEDQVTCDVTLLLLPSL